jgi:triosephosphate isomerase
MVREENLVKELLNKCFFLADIVCAPPALFIKDFVASKPSHVQVAGQNCYHAKEGAFTGELR